MPNIFPEKRSPIVSPASLDYIYDDGENPSWINSWSGDTDGGYLDSNVYFPADYVYRLSGNRNEALWKELMSKRKVSYQWKLVDTPYALKFRVLDLTTGRYKTKRLPGKAWRLSKVFSPFDRSEWIRRRLPNELWFRESKFLEVPTAELLQFSREGTRFEYPNPDPIPTFETLNVSGNVFAIPYLDPQGYAIPGSPLWGVISNSAPWRNISSCSQPISQLYSSDIESVDQVALGRFFKKLRNQKLDLATDIAEISQTVGMISDAAKIIAEAFLLAKKGKIAAALSKLLPKDRKQIADVWLAYRYGAAPLMGDIDGACQQLAEIVTRCQTRPVRAKFSRTVTKDLTEIWDTTNSVVSYVFREVFIEVHYHAIYEIADMRLREAARAGFTTPLNVAWELLPFSFVVDWFLPIGNYLNMLAATEGLTVKSLTRSVFLKETCTMVTDFSQCNDVDGWYYVEGGPLSWQIENVEFLRVDYPPELLRAPLPKLKNPLSTGHLANALALVQQAFGR